MDDINLNPADARDMLMLSTLAQDDGFLKGKRQGRDAFYDEPQLAAALRIGVQAFRRRWNRWQAAGWVTTTGRPNRGRLERLLVLEGQVTRKINRNLSSRTVTRKINRNLSHKEIDYGGSRGLVPVPRSSGWQWRQRAGDPNDCLRLGLDMLAIGIPVQVIKPSGTVIEVGPDDHGPLMRILGSNDPAIAVAALISDKPSPGVLRGRQEFRVSARRQRENPSAVLPLPRVLAALEDHGIRPARKGVRWHSRCPGHERSKSDALQVYERPDGKVNVKCFKDCDYRMILDLIGLRPADLYPR